MAFNPINKFFIVESRYYPEIADALATGAIAVLEAANVEYERIEVPGVLEIAPMIAMSLRKHNKNRRAGDIAIGHIALGCVIRGETTHYDIVANESARGLMDLGVHQLAAIGNGILTVENMEQAMKRADPNGKDKGGEAARAALALSKHAENFDVRYVYNDR